MVPSRKESAPAWTGISPFARAGPMPDESIQAITMAEKVDLHRQDRQFEKCLCDGYSQCRHRGFSICSITDLLTCIGKLAGLPPKIANGATSAVTDFRPDNHTMADIDAGQNGCLIAP